MNILDKTRLLQTSILSSLMMGLGGVAYAQVDTTPAEVEQIEAEEEDDFAEEKGEIVVTGSRLRRNEFTSASPLQVIDGELARDLGLVDASDLLGQTTVVQGQQITTGLSTSAGNLSANGPGSATASLRGLNPGRTLGSWLTAVVLLLLVFAALQVRLTLTLSQDPSCNALMCF